MKDFKVEKTAALFDENRYWEFVDCSLKNSISQKQQEYKLLEKLDDLSPEELISFRLRTDQLLEDSYSSKLWCAAFIMNHGCGDDSFEYFRCWVISRGKKVYRNAVDQPDSLVNELVEGREYYEFERFWYAPNEAFEWKTMRELYDYVDYEEWEKMKISNRIIDFDWEEDQPESMKAICPNLYTRLWDT